MFLLVVGGGQEQRGYLLKAFLFGLRGKIGVFVACLTLTGKSRQQVLLCLGAGIGVGW